MANLKNPIDEAAMMRRIAAVREDAQARLRETVESACGEIKEAVGAQRELPQRLEDLVARAAHAWIRNFTVHDDRRCWGPELRMGNVSVGFAYTDEGEWALRAGKYRAVVVLLPRDDEPEPAGE